MQSPRVFALRLLAGAIAAAPLGAAPLPEDQQWQCDAGTGGAWNCRAVPRGTLLVPAARPAPAPATPNIAPTAPSTAPEARNTAPAAPSTPPEAQSTAPAAPSTVPGTSGTAPVAQEDVPETPAPVSAASPDAASAPADSAPDDSEFDDPEAAKPVIEPLASNLDWVEEDQLDAEHAHGVPAHCGGTYVDPPLPAIPSSRVPVIGTIYASSDETELLKDAEVAHFRGNVSVRQDERRLRADEATYFRTEERVDIAGNVQYREPGLLVQGDKASFKTAESSGELFDGRFVLHREHARGAAERVVRNADRSIDLESGSYTHCEPGSDDWAIASRSIHLDRETGQGTARDARLLVGGVPVLYTPYLRFPIDDRRQSGFLWPEFTNSSQNGLDFATPYYFNLAPNYDATIVPRYLVDRGPMAGGEARYLDRYGEWVASGAYMPEDDVTGDTRWLTALQQSGILPHAVITSINYTEVSDEDYLRNLGATGLDVKRATHLAQSGAVRWNPAGTWTLDTRVQQYQLLDEELTEPYRMLPRVTLARGLAAEPFQPDYALTAEYTAFEHKDDVRLDATTGLLTDVVTGQRLFLDGSVTWPMEWPSGFVRPTVGYQTIGYNLDEPFCNPAVPSTCVDGNDSPSVSAPLASLDAGYFLERNTRWFGTDLLQTLEPRAYYLWVDNEDHSDIPNFDSLDLTFSFSQLFRPTRFAGHDRIADANQLSFSLTSRVIDDASGTELLTASIGEIRYFSNRRVTTANSPVVVQNQSTSALAAELQVQPDPRIAVTGSTLWDPREEQVDEGGLFVHWTPNDDTIVNLGYRYRRQQPFIEPTGLVSFEDIDQADFSTAVPISEHWKLLARYQYDFTNSQNLEETAGVEYSSCCWALRMVYQEGLDWDQGRDYGFYLEFVLRGLGGIGRNIDQLLQKSIFGYGEYERDYRVEK